MRVLMITGDRAFGPGHPRYELQRAAVAELVCVYMGRGSMWPNIPAGTFDVVTAQDPFWRGLFALRASRALGAKSNIQVHADLRGQTLVKRALARFVLRRANSIRVVSEKVKAQVMELGARAPIAVLPVYVDLDAVRAAPAAALKKEFPQFQKVVLWAGRLEPEKNCAEALSVFAQVLQSEPGAGLVIAGEGSQRQMLEERARNLGLSKNVVFLGHRADVFSLYKGANALLVTSWEESWGASIVEALAAGCPVVAPDVGVAKEAGALVVPRERLASGVSEVLHVGARGELVINLPSKEAWQKQWHDSLTA